MPITFTSIKIEPTISSIISICFGRLLPGILILLASDVSFAQRRISSNQFEQYTDSIIEYCGQVGEVERSNDQFKGVIVLFEPDGNGIQLRGYISEMVLTTQGVEKDAQLFYKKICIKGTLLMVNGVLRMIVKSGEDFHILAE